MGKRRAGRIKKRITCELEVAGRRYRGFVLDLSETGLFVQTDAAADPGAQLTVRLRVGDEPEVEVEASVARRQMVPPQLATVARGGLGLRVQRPPAAYFALLGMDGAAAEAARRRMARPPSPGAARSTASGATPRPQGSPRGGSRVAPSARPPPVPSREVPEKPALPAFRVRVKQTSGPRSRVLEVSAASLDDARRRARAKLGAGWEVLTVEAV